VVPEVQAVLDKMADFSNRLRSGTWKGHTGKRIRNVLNLGIGDPDLNPVITRTRAFSHLCKSNA
jgi:glucose-6-phosphate isomerase